MNGAAEVLVIILSVVLAIFLLLSVALVILLIRISAQIKTITKSAERTVQSVEAAASNMSKVTSPALILKLVTSMIKKSAGSSKGKSTKGDK